MRKIFLPFLFLAFACDSGKQKQTDLSMYVFDMGTIQVNDVSSLNGGEQITAPHYFTNTAFLIRHPLGDLIWDTGYNDSIAKNPLGEPDSPFYSTMGKTLRAQLVELKIDPLAIQYLAISHLHPDHSGNMELFANATLLLQQEEHQALFAEGGLGPVEMKSNPAPKLSANHDVFGDGTVRIIRTPGHTNGHQVLWVNLPERGPFVLSGDLYLFRPEIKSQGAPFFNLSRGATQRSKRLVEQLLDSTGAELWVQHDSVQMKSIPHAPKALR